MIVTSSHLKSKVPPLLQKNRLQERETISESVYSIYQPDNCNLWLQLSLENHKDWEVNQTNDTKSDPIICRKQRLQINPTFKQGFILENQQHQQFEQETKNRNQKKCQTFTLEDCSKVVQSLIFVDGSLIYPQNSEIQKKSNRNIQSTMQLPKVQKNEKRRENYDSKCACTIM